MLLASTFRSSTFRLALLSIALFGAAVLVLFWYVYSSTTSFVLRGLDRSITTELASLDEVFKRAGRNGLLATIKERTSDVRYADHIYLLADPSFAGLAGNLRAWPNIFGRGQEALELQGSDGHPPIRATAEALSDGSHLLVGRDIIGLADYRIQVQRAFGLALVFIFLLATLASILVTRRTVGRIEAINSTTRRIMGAGLDERIPLRGSHDEWDELASNLNSMLDRIEQLIIEVKQVSDSIAHDLRTPLSRMRARLEKASGKACRDEQNYDGLISELIGDLDGVLRIFSAIMRVSQIERLDQTAPFGTADLSIITTEVAELFDAAAEEKSSRLSLQAERNVMIRGDRDLLFDAIANLIDNAIKHGGDRGAVSVQVKTNEEGAVLSIADVGPGIPESERSNVFRRFYRLEQSRCTPGNGLGLSLVAAVARAHRAQMRLQDNLPGLIVELQFPAA